MMTSSQLSGNLLNEVIESSSFFSRGNSAIVKILLA